MTTPTPPTRSRIGYDLAVIAFCTSRIEIELQHGELDHYHRVDCETVDDRLAALRVELGQRRCDCDGPERLQALLQGDLQVLRILEGWSSIALTTSMRAMLDAIAKPFADRPDFPVLP